MAEITRNYSLISLRRSVHSRQPRGVSQKESVCHLESSPLKRSKGEALQSTCQGHLVTGMHVQFSPYRPDPPRSAQWPGLKSLKPTANTPQDSPCQMGSSMRTKGSALSNAALIDIPRHLPSQAVSDQVQPRSPECKFPPA